MSGSCSYHTFVVSTTNFISLVDVQIRVIGREPERHGDYGCAAVVTRVKLSQLVFTQFPIVPYPILSFVGSRT